MANYAKLAQLLADHGTEGINSYFKTHILQGQTPQQFFATNKAHIDNLHTGHRRPINQRQYGLIFPANNQPPDLKEFDITLLFLLIRQFYVRCFFAQNILNGQAFSDYVQSLQSPLVHLGLSRQQISQLRPSGAVAPQLHDVDTDALYKLIQHFHPVSIPVYKPNCPVWDDPAKATGAPQDMQDIILLKCERNKLAHRQSTNITDSEFNQKWTAISSVIIRQGVKTTSEIQELRDSHIDAKREQFYRDLLIAGYKEDMDIMDAVKRADEKLEGVAKKVENVDRKVEGVDKKLDSVVSKLQENSSSHLETHKTVTVRKTIIHNEYHSQQVSSPSQEKLTTEWTMDGALDEQLTLLQTHLAEKYNREMSCVPRIPWDETDTMSIDDVFIDLSVIQEKKQGTDTNTIDLVSFKEIFEPDITKNRTIIRGKAGSGKSTLVAKMAVDWARFMKRRSGNRSPEKSLQNASDKGQNSEINSLSHLERFSLLFLVRLRFLDENQSLLKAIKDQLIDPSLKLSGDMLERYMHTHANKVLIILDGYDEYNTTLQSQNDVVHLIHGKIHANVPVIVTTRPWKAHELSKFRASDLHVEIKCMDAERIKEFLLRHFKGRDPSYIEPILKYIDQCDLSESSTPLLILFLCILWDEKSPQQMPTSFTALYRDLINLLIKRFTTLTPSRESVFHKFQNLMRTDATLPLRQGNDETTESYLHVNTNILGKIALDGLLSGNLTFDENNPDIQALGEKIFHTGLLSRVKDTSSSRNSNSCSISFIHKTIQEYFAARYLVNSCSRDSNSESIQKFRSHINSYKQFLDMENVLRFVCGSSSETAAHILSNLNFSVEDPLFYHREDSIFSQRECITIVKLMLDSTFLLLIDEMISNERMVKPVHMTWFKHVDDELVHQIDESYPSTADCILEYSHQVTHICLPRPFTISHRVRCRFLHKLLFHTVFPSLQGLSLEASSFDNNPSDCQQLNHQFLSSTPMESLGICIFSKMNLGQFLSLVQVHPFPSLEELRLRKCYPIVHLVDIFQSMRTKNMTNLVCLDLSGTVLTECDLCKPEWKCISTKVYSSTLHKPFTVKASEGGSNVKKTQEHCIFADALCDLATQLEHLPMLKRLGLAGTGISPVGLQFLVDNLKYVRGLEHLDISKNSRHMDIQISTVLENLFRELKPMTMRFIKMGRCHFGLYGDMTIAMGILSHNLEHWGKLETLDISQNSMGDCVFLLVYFLVVTNISSQLRVDCIEGNAVRRKELDALLRKYSELTKIIR